MSTTVQDIIDLIQYRIDFQGDLLPLYNQAIGLIAKRLKWANSAIIKTELLLQAPGTTDYTASTIAFNATAVPNTLTDSANGFLTGGMAANRRITTTSTINPGPFRIVTAAAGILTLLNSDTLVTEAEGSSITVMMQNEYVALPTGFFGLGDRPEDRLIILNNRRRLSPLPSRDVAMHYLSPGIPQYYEILGTNMYLYPAPAEALTIVGRCYILPTKATTYSDTVPFSGMFDDVIGEYTIAAYKGEPLRVLQGMVYEAVDTVVAGYAHSMPVQPDNLIDWDRG